MRAATSYREALAQIADGVLPVFVAGTLDGEPVLATCGFRLDERAVRLSHQSEADAPQSCAAFHVALLQGVAERAAKDGVELP